MKKSLLLIGLFFAIASCRTTKNSGAENYGVDYGSPQLRQVLVDENTFLIEKYSQDKTYGYDEKNPVMVGGAADSEGPLNERRFLNALAGPNGEEINYYREGSCCGFNTKNSSYMGGGMLDMYKVSYEGIAEPVILVINMYDSDTLKVPVGFTLKK